MSTLNFGSNIFFFIKMTKSLLAYTVYENTMLMAFYIQEIIYHFN